MIWLAPDTLILTQRLVLRAARQADYQEWAQLRHDSRAHLEPWEPRWPSDALSARDFRRRLRAWNQAWRQGTAYVFLIRRLSDQKLIGGVSLTQVRPWPANSAALGYWIGATHTGQGYMTEAVCGLCDWAFETLCLARIEAGILPDNNRSRRVLERAGFAEEGRALQYLEINGIRRDHVLFGRVSSDVPGEVVC